MLNLTGVMTTLISFIQSQVNIPEAELQTICAHFYTLTIPKDRLLIKRGQLVNAYYFIVSGGLRIYLDKDGTEITAWLAFQHDFFTELRSVKTGMPTVFNIQAIEECELLCISKQDMELLYQRFPAWQQFGRKVWEDAFLKVVNGILAYQTMTAQERYLAMMQQSDLLQKVPLKQLASYLGVTQTSLSRLRKKLK
ncbi:MAG TPA: Crp/Fnr family transcriptional regulator [Chitinophagaceae bacterium]|nr:Crp/Fnr family transcriptional regulator [Chitinophagaceae bacterium]